MKKTLSLLASSLFLLAMVFTSCEGPMGPEGPEGTQGPEGPQGPAGEIGAVSCVECHDFSTDLFAKVLQFENSTHVTGGNYNRNYGACAICHTHEGYLDNLETGAGTSDAALVNTTHINCRTCHMIHENYDQTDWGLRGTDRITFFTGQEGPELGTGNQCASCHQSRSYDVPEVGGPDLTITSNRYGPHYGSQSDVMVGHSLYEIPGSMNYPSSNPHASIANGCVSCHMSAGYVDQSGGHTFAMRNESEAVNMTSCTMCHPSMTSADVDAFQAEIQVIYDELFAVLVDKGLMNGTTGLVNASSSAPLVIPGTQAAAIANYRTIYGDHSFGLHNPGYIKAILTNTLEAAQGF